MQAVILAGGKGTRMGSLSEVRPKPMLEVLGKNLLQHKIDRLPPEITEVIIVVHYKKEIIMDFFGSSYNGKQITYVDQGEPHGTGDALWKAEPLLKNEFISMMGDDIYCEESIKEIIKYPWAMTVMRAKSFPGTLDIKTDPEGYLQDALFDDEGAGSEILLDICLYKLNKEIFKTPLVKLRNKDEYGLPQTLFSFIKNTGTKMKVIETDKWIKVNAPTDLAEAEKILTSDF